MKMIYPTGIIRNWPSGDTVDILLDLGFRIFSKQRFQLAGLGNLSKDTNLLNAVKVIAMQLAPVNTRVSVECLGYLQSGIWIADIILSDDTNLNNLLLKEFQKG